MSDVEFTGPDGEPFPSDSSVGDAAWHGGFDMTLNGKVVRSNYRYAARSSSTPRFYALGSDMCVVVHL